MLRGMEFFANGLVFSLSLLKVNIPENDIFSVKKPGKLNEVASYYSNFDLRKATQSTRRPERRSVLHFIFKKLYIFTF